MFIRKNNLLNYRNNYSICLEFGNLYQTWAICMSKIIFFNDANDFKSYDYYVVCYSKKGTQ